MLIAQQKRKENIAEYLLYLWQLEDLLRSLELNEERAKQVLADRFEVEDSQKEEIAQWYASLIDMMRQEGIQQQGHLQISRNALNELTEAHRRLLQSSKESFYTAAYFQTLPYIVELRSKQKGEPLGEIETCFVALYGVMTMRMKGEQLSEQTAKAVEQITRFVALLAHKYHTIDQEEA